MNKSFYLFTIFFLGLALAAGCLQSIIELWPGSDIKSLGAFILWFAGVNLISLVGSLFMLRYYYYKQFGFTFYAGAITALSKLCHFVTVYKAFETRQLGSYYFPVLFVFFCSGILYAVSLLFSGTRKMFWLKTAGIFLLVISLILLYILIWVLEHPGATNNTLLKIQLWTSMVSSLVPALFIMHFVKELKILKSQNTEIPMQRSVENILGGIGVAAFFYIATYGVVLATESYSQIYWGKRNFEGTKEMARLFEARIYVNSSGDTLQYRLLKPLHYDPQKKYPLVVSLPFGGQPNTDKIRQLQGAQAAEILSSDINRKKYPAFLFVPNCPPGSGWGGIPNYPSVDSLVYEAINSLDKEFSIDVKRQYVTGISRGGYGAWHFICTRPEMFAAAIPICGGENPKLAPKIVHVAVWAFHGAKDQNVPVSGSRNMISAIRRAGGNPKYTEYPNEGHNIGYQVSITPGLWDWLFAQKRN